MMIVVYLNHQGLVLDAKLAHYTSSERDLAFQHLEHTDDNDLVLYDRDYSAFWLVLAHTVSKREFCMRIRRNFNKQTEAFEKSTQKQTVITLEATQDMIEKAKEKGLIIEAVRVRLLKVKTKKGVYLLLQLGYFHFRLTPKVGQFCMFINNSYCIHLLFSFKMLKYHY